MTKSGRTRKFIVKPNKANYINEEEIIEQIYNFVSFNLNEKIDRLIELNSSKFLTIYFLISMINVKKLIAS